MEQSLIQQEIQRMGELYEQHMAGKTTEWTSYTKCRVCDKAWLWGVKDNLNFICPDHTYPRNAEGMKEVSENTFLY